MSEYNKTTIDALTEIVQAATRDRSTVITSGLRVALVEVIAPGNLPLLGEVTSEAERLLVLNGSKVQAGEAVRKEFSKSYDIGTTLGNIAGQAFLLGQSQSGEVL